MAKGYRSALFAYPAQPTDLAAPIITALETISGSPIGTEVRGWPQLEVFGANLADEIRKTIRNSDILLADITRPNSNVYYEIGYAIGNGRTVAPVVNVSFAHAAERIQRDGIFDNIGYKSYENSAELTEIIRLLPEHNLNELYAKPINYQQPLFFLQAFRKTDFINTIVSSIKGARVHFRSFDPAEVPRLSAVSMIAELSASSGVIIPLLAEYVDDSERHNLRAAFMAGLSHGLGRQTLLLRLLGEETAEPADFRELITTTKIDLIGDAVDQFAKNALVAAQSIRTSVGAQKNRLQIISMGSSAAENEFRTLSEYFVETSEYLKALRGETRVIAGRKGSGKTAIFFQVRDALREKKGSIVVDLKPESHQLSLFREKLLEQVGAGLFDHTIAAFWYFVLCAEALLTIKRNLDFRAKYDGRALEESNAIRQLLSEFDIAEAGDFTLRLSRLEGRLLSDLELLKRSGPTLSPNALTNIVFKRGISDLRNAIVEHSSQDGPIVLLFDNIDKGWPANGVQDFDVRLVRLLVETLDKIGRDFRASRREFMSIVFLRNDIYELLVEATPDRGKAGHSRIDWTDRGKLRQVLFRRLQAATGNHKVSFEELWREYFPPSICDRPAFEYIVDHCLMRPRFLINIMEYSIANAINRGHLTVAEEDCLDAIAQHSNYLVDDFGYEIRDVSGISADILYSFIGVGELLTREEVFDILARAGIRREEGNVAFRLMRWYGVLGISSREGEIKYIYDFDYNEKRLDTEVILQHDDVLYVVNPALHVALR